MSNGHGGSRLGAGQKKKPLADKMLDGNPGKRKLTVVEFPNTANLQGNDMPLPRELLSATSKRRRFTRLHGTGLTSAAQLGSFHRCYWSVTP